MIMNNGIIISMFDSKAENWTQPTPFDSKASAIRSFEDIVNDRQPTIISLHPEDFTLFMIGEFSGPVLKGCDKFALANGIDVKHKPLEVK